MAKGQPYKNAPITEAIIDIRVKPRAGLVLADSERAWQEEEARFPKKSAIIFAIGEMEVGNQVSASARSEQTGFKYSSSDEKLIFQSRLSGFTLSRLAPYESWEPFSTEGRRLWTIYRDRLQPEAVTRLAVRYINRIDLPASGAELKDYFRTSPEISPDLPQLMEQFFMRVMLRQEDVRASSVINMAPVQSPLPGGVSIVLDIGLFRAEDVPQEEEAVWNVFESLREKKDQIFEACITDRTRELFA
jgi:uncharacterized protein (TIGR04255 family)